MMVRLFCAFSIFFFCYNCTLSISKQVNKRKEAVEKYHYQMVRQKKSRKSRLKTNTEEFREQQYQKQRRRGMKARDALNWIELNVGRSFNWTINTCLRSTKWLSAARQSKVDSKCGVFFWVKGSSKSAARAFFLATISILSTFHFANDQKHKRARQKFKNLRGGLQPNLKLKSRKKVSSSKIDRIQSNQRFLRHFLWGSSGLTPPCDHIWPNSQFLVRLHCHWQLSRCCHLDVLVPSTYSYLLMILLPLAIARC